ncbi:hypothetical protein [Pseudomonas phage PhiPizzaParty]|nr:hypothetical protein [Pseudomonas phage vB_PA32_GUMS]WNV50348.1 hypothetical protein [Pseudomonas phage PhiPizzaParty]WPJ69470.1 hypothetical protein PAZH1_347 [Pseudomonas phage PA_ZH1]
MNDIKNTLLVRLERKQKAKRIDKLQRLGLWFILLLCVSNLFVQLIKGIF